ncbi:MAG TPA: BamA/TamA family outer membrane protein, partial [Chryseosolibacter sp.]|nr:BamA/TamA family outer membrane protein [Chryseosolibacter sp.]
EWSNEIGMNVTQGYPGPFYNLTFKKRNIFRGLENFELNGRIGFEGVAAATSSGGVYRSTEAGVNASLVFPQFIFPFREATQIRFGKYNPKTRLSVGYSYSDRPEYRRASINLSNNYTWQTARNTQYSLSPVNISLIKSTETAAFRARLRQLDSLGNYNLVRSFNPSFVSSMIFTVTWNRNYGTYDRNAVFTRAQIETGGTSLNFIDPGFITKQGLQYFKYLRFNLDYRKVRILNRWATFAYRLNTGVAYSYGANHSLPYEKFYFAGGSNSIRAWRPRRLGPGSVPPTLNTNMTDDGMFDYQFEKPGEILIEGSMELRSKIIGFVDGAVFVDAGNVWSFRNLSSESTDASTQKGNAQLDPSTFYKEIAIGTGFGLRFDFTFLILRFDIGIKVYDPARDEGDKFVLDKVSFFKPYAKQDANGNFYDIREPVIYNVGIGFPF